MNTAKENLKLLQVCARRLSLIQIDVSLPYWIAVAQLSWDRLYSCHCLLMLFSHLLTPISQRDQQKFHRTVSSLMSKDCSSNLSDLDRPELETDQGLTLAPIGMQYPAAA